MQTAEELKSLLDRIDHRGYPVYKETKGIYDFGEYILSIDHVQGDPFASPSRLSIRVSGRMAGFPEVLYGMPCRRIALQDALLRGFGAQAEQASYQAKGLRSQRPDLRQPLRAGGAGADRLLYRGRRERPGAAGGGVSRQRADHQRPGTGEDPLYTAAPVRAGVPAL